MADEKDNGQEAEIELVVDPALDDQPELPLDAAPAKEPDKEPDKPAAELEPEVKTDPVVAELRAQLAAEREAKNRATAIAVQKTREASAEQANGLLHQYNLIDNSLRGAMAERERLKYESQQALEVGDTARVAAIMSDQADLAVRIRDMEEGKAQIEATAQRQREAADRQRQTPQRQPARQAAPSVDTYIDALPVGEPTKDWLRRHPECVTDPAKAEAARRYDAVAQDRGLTPNTPAYFAYIEERMGYRQPAANGGKTVRQTQYAAPVSRSGDGVSSPTKVRLTAAEMAMAKALDMSNEDYARGKYHTQLKTKG